MTRAAKAARDRLSDRVAIGMLIEAFPPAEVDAAIDAAGVREQRSRSLPARTMVYFTLALWLFGGAGYDAVLARLTAGMRWAGVPLGKRSAPSTGSITKARKRLGPEVMRRLLQGRALADRAADERSGRAADERWRGLRVCTLDSGAVSVADTPANLAAFGGPDVWLSVLASPGRGVLVDVGVGTAPDDPGRSVLDALTPGTLVVSHRPGRAQDLWHTAAEVGADLLWCPRPSVALPRLQPLPDGTFLSRLVPDHDPLASSVAVRVLEVPDAVLVTTLLDPEQAPVAELAALHRGRWRFEALFDTLETGPVTLRSQDPDGVTQELWAMLCVYQAARPWRKEAASQVSASEDSPSTAQNPTPRRSTMVDLA
ncbi:transposase domain-containing protein [Actinokineospora spheciospongiae]|uniref:transposase domain-containing protein n=1 Tax=Actinokineospora spheciospongiae TaxID=909613 RepID=UPI000D71400D|nr:transposase domain-containing protein [Actinokineospora spheciospongiae]PWW57048.1 transposase IS4-like protein [Actinokineospora spheciospongiae]